MNQPPKNSRRAPPSANRRKEMLIISTMVAVIFLALAFIGYQWIKNEPLATLVDFTGETERDESSSVGQWQAAESDDKFANGDGARTSEDSVAQFRLINGAKLRLRPLSQVRFKNQHANGKSGLGVDVDVGEADIESDEAVTIASEFGEIVLDAKSAITMTRKGDRLVLGVDLGRIEIGDERRVAAAGQDLVVELDGTVADVASVAEPAPTASATALPEPEPARVLEVGDGVSRAALSVKAGDSFVVHDPSPPTAVGFRVSTLCPEGAQVTSGKQKTEALLTANLALAAGSHKYEVRCLDKPDVIAAQGTVRVLQDAGTRPLPSFSPKAHVTTDGRRYSVLYQHRLPRVTVSWPNAPQASAYTLTVDGKAISTQSPSYTFRSLRRGRHQVVFAAKSTPPRQSRATTIEVIYDTQAPAARVSYSEGDLNAANQLTLSGQALPGWNVSIDGKPLEVDGSQKFKVKVDNRIDSPIAFSHPSRGTHYYLRRAKTAEP